MRLAEGRFYTRLHRGVSELQFSPHMAWVNNVQFDAQSGVLGSQSRYRWILRPGTDIYLVYNHNWVDDSLSARGFRSLDNRLFSKLLYRIASDVLRLRLRTPTPYSDSRVCDIIHPD